MSPVIGQNIRKKGTQTKNLADPYEKCPKTMLRNDMTLHLCVHAAGSALTALIIRPRYLPSLTQHLWSRSKPRQMNHFCYKCYEIFTVSQQSCSCFNKQNWSHAEMISGAGDMRNNSASDDITPPLFADRLILSDALFPKCLRCVWESDSSVCVKERSPREAKNLKCNTAQ